MLLTMVFGLFSLSFPMNFHGGAFREIPYGSQGPPEAPQAALSLHGTKVEGPKDQSLPGETKIGVVVVILRPNK